MLRLSILAIGSELLDGRVVDTNSNYLAKKLSNFGLQVTSIHSCDDKISEIRDALGFLARSSEVIIISGGLGPTADDLTREALAEFIGVNLEFDEQVYKGLEALYAKRKRHLDPSNRKQAFFPAGSTVIPNPVGTAAGCKCSATISSRSICFYSLPGVPSEFTRMVDETILPEVKILSGNTSIYKSCFEIFGLPEAVVGTKILALKLPAAISVSYRAKMPTIQVVIKCSELNLLHEWSPKVAEGIGSHFIYSTVEDQAIEQSIHDLLLVKKQTVAVAESCTGGKIGARLSNLPGSSAYFVGGVVSYSNSVKESALAVSKDTIQKFGAVSFNTAKEMATGVRKALSSDYAISVTGIAGPDGGSDEKPVGTFFVGFSSKDKTYALKAFFPSSRHNIRSYATHMALDILRRELLGLTAHPDLRNE